MARRGYGPAARRQPDEPSRTVDQETAAPSSERGSPPPGEETPLEGQLEFVTISPLKRLPFIGGKATSLAELRQVGTPVARLRRPSGGLAAWFGKPELHFATTRMRLADPPSAGFFEQLRRNVGFFGMPQRQQVWRAGAGTVTQIEETSSDRKTLSGLFSYRDEHYQLDGGRTDWRGLFSYTLRDSRDMIATFRPKQNAGLTSGWFVEVIRPRPVGAIAIACHMALWLEESVGGSGGAGGAGGGGGGGGGGC